MSEAIPDYVGVYKMHGGGVSYTARAIRCGDRLAVVVAPEFVRNWGLEEGEWVMVRLNYIGPLDEKEWMRSLEILHSLGGSVTLRSSPA
jgi:hypothetical protein